LFYESVSSILPFLLFFSIFSSPSLSSATPFNLFLQLNNLIFNILLLLLLLIFTFTSLFLFLLFLFLQRILLNILLLHHHLFRSHDLRNCVFKVWKCLSNRDYFSSLR
jgi:hypothetical protein